MYFYRVANEKKKFSHVLHILYLINDVGHHCARKSLTDLQKSLGDVVPPIFGIAYHEESADHREKITKVQKIWETNKIFEADIMEVCCCHNLIL